LTHSSWVNINAGWYERIIGLTQVIALVPELVLGYRPVAADDRSSTTLPWDAASVAAASTPLSWATAAGTSEKPVAPN
jgi:hypothetical protein